jgi:hypothetical protein
MRGIITYAAIDLLTWDILSKRNDAKNSVNGGKGRIEVTVHFCYETYANYGVEKTRRACSFLYIVGLLKCMHAVHNRGQRGPSLEPRVLNAVKGAQVWYLEFSMRSIGQKMG